MWIQILESSTLNTNKQAPLLESSLDSSDIANAMKDSLHTPSHIPSLGYINAFMKNKNLHIITNGGALGYSFTAHKSDKHAIFLTSQFVFTDVNLYGAKDEHSTNLGGIIMLDSSLFHTDKGHHIFGLDFGYAIGLPNSHKSEFNEHNLLFNLEYGYAFVFDNLSLIPYGRFESYVFAPRNYHKHIFTDGGLNVILGFKMLQEFQYIDWGINVGGLSDLNLSGSGMGILADNTIVYDKDGMSNGIFMELYFEILKYENFSLILKNNFSYMLSYYEINTKTNISMVYKF